MNKNEIKIAENKCFFEYEKIQSKTEEVNKDIYSLLSQLEKKGLIAKEILETLSNKNQEKQDRINLLLDEIEEAQNEIQKAQDKNETIGLKDLGLKTEKLLANMHMISSEENVSVNKYFIYELQKMSFLFNDIEKENFNNIENKHNESVNIYNNWIKDYTKVVDMLVSFQEDFKVKNISSSLIDDYADPNLDQPSYMDPED